MVIRGRSRGNGSQLADYLLNNKENDLAKVLDVRGTASPQSLKKSLLEMSLSSELTKGVHGLYHVQMNPAIGEDRLMTQEDWQKAADILEQHLGFEGQKRAIVLHEKKGRIHAHIVWERCDHDTNTLKKDGLNYKKHDAARAEIERALGHELTPQREQHVEPEQVQKKSDIKRELSDLWEQNPDGQSFIKAAEKAGYQIAKADDRRPWRVITPDGESLDLVRQLENAKTKDVRERLQPIQNEIKTVAEALENARGAIQKEKEQARPDPKQSGKSRELSDSQDLALKMVDHVNDQKQLEQAKPIPDSYSHAFKFKQPLVNSQPKEEPEIGREMSDSEDLAAAMLEKFREERVEQQRKLREMLKESREAYEERPKEPGRDRGYDR